MFIFMLIVFFNDNVYVFHDNHNKITKRNAKLMFANNFLYINDLLLSQQNDQK